MNPTLAAAVEQLVVAVEQLVVAVEQLVVAVARALSSPGSCNRRRSSLRSADSRRRLNTSARRG